MIKINYRSLKSLLLSISVFISILSLQQSYLSTDLSSTKNINYQKKEKNLKAEAIFLKQVPSFGFNNLIADWAFLKYIQYFGNADARGEIGYSVIPDYFETIVEKDPKFIQATLSLSAGNSIFAGKPEKTVALLEKSTEFLTPSMPNYPFMVFAYKAVDEIIFLGDLKSAQQSYSDAAQWAKTRDDEIGVHVAKLYQDTIKFLDTNPDSSITQVSGWSMVLKRNNDPRIQKHAIKKIRDLGGEVTISANGEITVKPPKKDV